MSRFKTELCNNLIELGTCKYGDRCHYAHGHHELRQVSRRHPKYRTETCKNFELTGKCPFGPRCSYVHPKPDLDQLIDQLSRYMKQKQAPKPELDDEYETPMLTPTTLETDDDEDKENRIFDFTSHIRHHTKKQHNIPIRDLAKTTPPMHKYFNDDHEDNDEVGDENTMQPLINNTTYINRISPARNASHNPLNSLSIFSYTLNESDGKKLRLINPNNSSINISSATRDEAFASASKSTADGFPACADDSSSLFSMPDKKNVFERNQKTFNSISSTSLRNSNVSSASNNENSLTIQPNSITTSDYKTLRSIFSNDTVASVGNNDSNSGNLNPNKLLFTRF